MIKYYSLLFTICISVLVSGQEDKQMYSLDVNNFYGTILKHNPDISHLITGHPTGVIFSFQYKTFGEKDWQRLYNAPDYGFTFIYQDLDNTYLGQNAGLYAHFNFYFLKRLVMFRLGQGVAYTNNPYDIDDNFRNVAYGSHFMSSTFALLNLKKENLIGGLGLQLGAGVIHYSNANVKAPNKSTNTFVFTAGMNYLLDKEAVRTYKKKEKGLVKGSEPIGFGMFIRSGINESDVVGSGQYPFVTIGGYADKRINKKSAFHLGGELFFSKALERFIDFRASGNFEDGVTGEEDAKRVGVYAGHELRIDKISVLTQLGYYIYYPFDFEGRVYNRMGLQWYFTKNITGSVTVRSHAAKAEAAEFSIGYRL